MNGKKTTSIMGDGPRLALYLLPVLVAAIALGVLFPGRFAFEGRFYGIAFAIGMELAAFGLAFQASSAWQLIRAYRAGALATRGSFALCRNPIYSWWIFSVIPALALMLDNGLLLAVAVLFRFLSGRLAKREEEELESVFGDEYLIYRARVRPFLPIPRFRPFSIRRYFRAALVLAALGAAALAVFAVVVTPAMVRLGASRAELAAAMPGDAYVGPGAKGYTQAIDVGAPADELWKWLVQVGYRKAGWYNFDAINRLAAPDYFHEPGGSARRIIPEFQDLAPGDKVFLVPQLGMTVVEALPGRSLVMAADPGRKGGDNVAWSYSISPRGEGGCRLVTRFLVSVPASGAGAGGMLMGLIGDLVNSLGGATIQQPAMLWGIKRRAESAGAEASYGATGRP
jgi:protein-S-isoprenylcysteine O-methyltransferase Ste14